MYALFPASTEVRDAARAFAELSLWRADGSMRIVRAIPPVFTSRATLFCGC
jgi:hypothetical protein